MATGVSIIATWFGAVAGNAGVSLHDITVATLNMLPAIAVFYGLAILLMGVLPGMTVPIGAGAAVAGYALTVVGPALDWPQWVLDLSPFTHLSAAPVDPVEWTAVGLLLLIGVAATGMGFLGYQRRDLA
jgi:ABC-2 type transport system permease protein